MRGGKSWDGTGKFYINNVLPSCGEGWWRSQWGGCLLFLQRWNHHRPNQRISLMKYGSKIQISFPKVRRSLGVYFPWKPVGAFENFISDFFWRQECFSSRERFSSGWSFSYIQFLTFSPLSFTKKGGEGGRKAPDKILHSLYPPKEISLPILIWEQKSYNNDSSLLNLKLCHLTEYGPVGQHGKQEDCTSKSLCGRAQIIPFSYLPWLQNSR